MIAIPSQKKRTRSIVVIWVKQIQTEIMVEIYPLVPFDHFLTYPTVLHHYARLDMCQRAVDKKTVSKEKTQKLDDARDVE